MDKIILIVKLVLVNICLFSQAYGPALSLNPFNARIGHVIGIDSQGVYVCYQSPLAEYLPALVVDC